MSNEAISTVVLVHAAFADTSMWSSVVTELQNNAIPVLAPANPLRGLAYDADYTASFVRQLGGPVVLVGHSYGGAVITVAGMAENVVGLVYVAAHCLDVGESLDDLQGRYPAAPVTRHLRTMRFPLAGPSEPGVEDSISPDAFPSIFAPDLPPEIANVLAVSQRPLVRSAWSEPASAAAWKVKPAWALVATGDNSINPQAQRFAYERAGAFTVEVDASHAVPLSQPKAVADLVREAVKATSSS
ncbi:alpha/beta fold hydrolase [Actinopolymorpha singaporensis]|uniref:Pimeloyl-ACP methyl ester carboxylesterase n=1 Tax=Actinopolymorpha singaporensis TaxID=117157 RepID=A0A1H1TZG6_9ACTN|nr:alpha/beta hydrolase [Actinopolymorpha singaporensis]SDS65376.1 Pimeloyl-ACP methyl ester carboxylesterase [Actinopolymorpha singaporensis]